MRPLGHVLVCVLCHPLVKGAAYCFIDLILKDAYSATMIRLHHACAEPTEQILFAYEIIQYPYSTISYDRGYHYY